MARKLSDSQLKALLDILVHTATYHEIEDFKAPDAILQYGRPFQGDDIKPRTPILQALFTEFALPLPGLNAAASIFWPDRVLPLIKALSAANLSESYDKGVLGQRKTVATAISVLLEYPARGYFGGFEREPLAAQDREYDANNPDDLEIAWSNFLQQAVYVDLVDEEFKMVAETPNLSDHSSLIQATHRYIVLNLASLLHYTFIISPKGPALLALLERAHKLIPYALIKQTLKVGNAATMINGMVSIVLAKASVGALTNWIGFSEGAAEGMNLLQTIVSTVLGWDNKKLRARIAEIEKDRESPSKDQLSTLKEYTNKSREEQMKLRQDSRSTSKSIISIILSLQPDHQISEPTHRLAMEYLDLLLSIRDHEQLSTILCNHNPDLLTPILRDLVSAYDPIIRGIHNAVNLSGTISDAQAFIRDFIQLSRRSTNSNPDENVSVRDYVELLEKHQSSSHRFLHQVTKNGKELTATYLAYVHTVIEKFKHDEQATRSSTRSASLGSLIQSLPDPTFTKVSAELTSHSNYLDHISSASSSLASEVMQSNSNTSRMTQGPGVYLVRWQSLLDSTEISPSEARGGKIRHGADLEVREAARVDVDGSKKGSEDDVGNAGSNEQAPDLTNTLSALREKFCESLRTWKA